MRLVNICAAQFAVVFFLNTVDNDNQHSHVYAPNKLENSGKCQLSIYNDPYHSMHHF